MDRTERQKLCIKRWLGAGGSATVVASTGFGKTRVGLLAAELLIKKKSDAKVLISVPTEILKEQWMEELIQRNMLSNCRVMVINSIVKGDWEVDLLIIDECHLVASDTFRAIFDRVTYNMVLCLTGTLERLDGKEVVIKQYAPVCDNIPMKEALANGWVSPVKEYVVMLDVDLTEYNKLNQTFIGFFSQMNYDFELAMKCATDAMYRNKIAKKLGLKPKELAGIAFGWLKALKGRKAFVQSHPKKFEIARKILDARKDKKCITFSATIKDAESLNNGEFVLHSKKSKKQNNEILEVFNNATEGVIHSSKSCDQGVDIRGLSVGIILSTDSSKIRKTQRNGRICRFEEGKTAELFTLVIRGTQEWNWFQNSVTTNYTVINESQLDKVLAGEIIETRERENVEDKKFRF